MRISLKIACFIASAVVVALIWLYTPVKKPPEELWTLGFKLRLSGFAVIGLIFFYFFFDRIVFVKKKKGIRSSLPEQQADLRKPIGSRFPGHAQFFT